MVTNYNNEKCKYTFSKLKKVIYLVSKEHVKDISIDNGEAFISGLTELPLRLNGFDIKFTEEESLDERYLFQKTVTLSMHGYVNHNIFSEKYYVILEDMEGTYWMVNVDFPSRMTYTFNLSKDTYQTDFTLSSYSNFPTLRLLADFVAVSPPCIGLNTYGVKGLRLIQYGHATINTKTKVLSTFGDVSFKDIDYLGNSCTFSSQFDGFNVTDTITFQIPFDSYKSSWHYNLLEFTENIYSAALKPKSSNNEFYIGFNLGLQPSYRIETGDKENSDIITITLTETSVHGLTSAVDWTEEQRTGTKWVWALDVDGLQCWECVSRGKAKYLLKKEVLDNGVGTGNYMALDGYEDYFSGTGINITETFSGETLFDNSSCGGDGCEIYTDMPSNITFTSTTCNTYSIQTGCEWSIQNKTANWITVSPSSGTEESETITVCNTKTPTGNEKAYFDIVSGDNNKKVTVTLNDNTYFINPTAITIDCLSQDVYFTYDPLCAISVLSSDTRTTYHITNGNLIVRVPRNYELSSTTYSYTVKDCQNKTQTITINQNQTYEQWLGTTGYLCDGGNSYTREARYTGTTSGNCNVVTGEYRKGTLIQNGDIRCAETVYVKWLPSSDYMCIDGNKWSMEEEWYSTDNSSWTKTGNVRPLAMVESASTFCESSVTYSWVLTERWQCVEETPYSGQYLTIESQSDNNTIYWKVSSAYTSSVKTISASTDGGNTWAAKTATSGGTSIATLNTGDKVLLKGKNGMYLWNMFDSDGSFKLYGNIMSLVSGDSFTSATTLGVACYAQMFYGCTGLTSAENLILPATAKENCYDSMFRECTNLTTAPALPATTLDVACYIGMFRGCTSLTAAPALPATTLARSCYESMFDGCTSLTTAPELPATTLGSFCYFNMFDGCTSLTTTPELPATTLADYCYTGMFNGCTGLTAAPELPATTLSDYCYQGMFSHCTRITTAPILSATTLARSCYHHMFYGCSSLNYVKCLATDILADDCTYRWLNNVSSTGTFVKASGMNDWTTGMNGIPSGWTVQDA